MVYFSIKLRNASLSYRRAFASEKRTTPLLFCLSILRNIQSTTTQVPYAVVNRIWRSIDWLAVLDNILITLRRILYRVVVGCKHRITISYSSHRKQYFQSKCSSHVRHFHPLAKAKLYRMMRVVTLKRKMNKQNKLKKVCLLVGWQTTVTLIKVITDSSC